jgi:hypothetical protein
MPEAFDECFEEIRFTRAILAEENGQEAITLETEVEILQILVVADGIFWGRITMNFQF